MTTESKVSPSAKEVDSFCRRQIAAALLADRRLTIDVIREMVREIRATKDVCSGRRVDADLVPGGYYPLPSEALREAVK